MDDRTRIIDWMMSNACGFRSILPRQQIAQALNLPDRLFRRICADIPEIITNSKLRHIKEWGYEITVKPGYYILPLTDYSGTETKIAKILLRETTSRLIKLARKEKTKMLLLRNRFGAERQTVFV